MLQVELHLVHTSKDSIPDGLVEELNLKTIDKDVSTDPLDPNYHLIVGKEVSSRAEILHNVTAGLKTGGFILSEEKNFSQNDSLFEKLGLVTASVQKTSEFSYVLLRKVSISHTFFFDFIKRRLKFL